MPNIIDFWDVVDIRIPEGTVAIIADENGDIIWTRPDGIRIRSRRVNVKNVLETKSIVVNNNNIYLGSGRGVPEGYQEVEYIQNSGYQYIDTLYYTGPNTRVVVDAQEVTSNSYPRIFASGTYQNYAMVLGYESNGNLYLRTTYQTSYVATSIPRDYERHLYEIDKNLVKIDGETIYTGTASPGGASPGTLHIFASSPSASSSDTLKGKLYHVEIYENDTLAMELVPCYRTSDSVVGVYDKVGDRFFTASGSGTFTYGPPIYKLVEIVPVVQLSAVEDINVLNVVENPDIATNNDSEGCTISETITPVSVSVTPIVISPVIDTPNINIT